MLDGQEPEPSPCGKVSPVEAQRPVQPHDLSRLLYSLAGHLADATLPVCAFESAPAQDQLQCDLVFWVAARGGLIGVNGAARATYPCYRDPQ